VLFKPLRLCIYFIGGIFADKVLGFKNHSFGASVMILESDNRIFAAAFFYLGITLTIIGTGFFKPNISSMVGSFIKWGRRDAGFGFYSGINIGALLEELFVCT
jgi:POT family proton-dependent oligopeptide transporter